jgi:acyl phosphate:glycerol-3-phosphate acyltransferase
MHLETALLDAAVKIVLAYLAGSLLGSLLIGQLRGGVDIRKLGSGNAGGTNALRTQGIWFAIGVMVVDVGKGYIAAALLPQAWQADATSRFDFVWLQLACAMAVAFGHVYPIWFGFRGGKGAATLIGVVLGLNPPAALAMLGVWTLVLLLSGYVGLATIIATVSFPIYSIWVLQSTPLAVFGVLMALFVTYTHRSNIARMRAGTEHRSQRLWLLRPK